MQKISFYLIVITLLFSCEKDDKPKISLNEKFVEVGSHKLMSYISDTNSEYLIVFESGLGDDHSIWANNIKADEVVKTMDVLLYDRGGYGLPTIDNNKRNIKQLSLELEALISYHSANRKVILVGHSLGGMIIRDYAIKNPDKIAALLFVDASHELYNNPSQEEENLLYNTFLNAYGKNSGAAKEARELIENSQYMASLSNLPDVPVIAITSMKIDANHDNEDRELWFKSKEMLKKGVSDFEHITTTNSGHYIMLDEPKLIIDSLKLLISKL